MALTQTKEFVYIMMEKFMTLRDQERLGLIRTNRTLTDHYLRCTKLGKFNLEPIKVDGALLGMDLHLRRTLTNIGLVISFNMAPEGELLEPEKAFNGDITSAFREHKSVQTLELL